MRRLAGDAQRRSLASSLSLEDRGEQGDVAHSAKESGPFLNAQLRIGYWESSLLQDLGDCLQHIQTEITRGSTRAQARQQALIKITERILQAVRELAEHGVDTDDYPPPLLTNRQCEVLTLLRTGMRVQTVARNLRLSEQTVRSHIRDICGRLGVSGITAAIYRAQALNLIS